MLLRNKQVITILGPTGDLGSQFANYLIKKRKKVLLVIRSGDADLLKRRVHRNETAHLRTVASLFNKQFIHSLLTSSTTIFDLAGLVSLSFHPTVYPQVLLINGIFPGILAYMNNTIDTPVIYASTQRMQILQKRQDINKWITKVRPICQNYIKNAPDSGDFEKDAIEFVAGLLKSHPLPPINIYELSKALGEALLGKSKPSIILRISGCYGPGCSSNRTIGRLIFARLAAEPIKEKEEVRDYLYIKDLCEIFGNICKLKPNRPFIKYCCSGINASKSYIIKKIMEKTPKEKGSLNTIGSNTTEKMQPSGNWVKKILQRQPESLEDGLSETIKDFRRKFFSKNPMSIKKRLVELYAREKQKVIEQGVNPQEVEKLKRTYFNFIDGKWDAVDAYRKPTGLVFGLPLPNDITNQLDSISNDILTEAGLKQHQFWKPHKQLLHSTLISYSHYLRSGTKLTSLPSPEMTNAKQIVGRYYPIEILFKGILITNFGSLLAKGFVENDDLFLLRNELLSKINGIQQHQNNLIHVKLGQILDPVPYERIENANRVYSDVPLGSIVFDHITAHSGEHLKFKIK